MENEKEEKPFLKRIGVCKQHYNEYLNRSKLKRFSGDWIMKRDINKCVHCEEKALFLLECWVYDEGEYYFCYTLPKPLKESTRKLMMEKINKEIERYRIKYGNH